MEEFYIVRIVTFFPGLMAFLACCILPFCSEQSSLITFTHPWGWMHPFWYLSENAGTPVLYFTLKSFLYLFPAVPTALAAMWHCQMSLFWAFFTGNFCSLCFLTLIRMFLQGTAVAEVVSQTGPGQITVPVCWKVHHPVIFWTRIKTSVQQGFLEPGSFPCRSHKLLCRKRGKQLIWARRTWSCWCVLL